MMGDGLTLRRMAFWRLLCDELDMWCTESRSRKARKRTLVHSILNIIHIQWKGF